jgi:hypothetical protein
VTPLRLKDSLARVHTRRTASGPLPAGSTRVLHTIHTPYDDDPFLVVAIES